MADASCQAGSATKLLRQQIPRQGAHRAARPGFCVAAQENSLRSSLAIRECDSPGVSDSGEMLNYAAAMGRDRPRIGWVLVTTPVKGHFKRFSAIACECWRSHGKTRGFRGVPPLVRSNKLSSRESRRLVLTRKSCVFPEDCAATSDSFTGVRRVTKAPVLGVRNIEFVVTS